MLKSVISVVVSIFISVSAWSQVTPVPCTSPPNGPGCLCSTAGILCTPDELDNFSFSMSSLTNLGGLPSGPFNADLCPGINNQDGVPNNVNWFAFIAWCTDLTIDVIISNCQPGGSGNYGVQVALFGNCSSGSSGWDPIECFTQGNDYCHGTPADVVSPLTFPTSGLTIGDVYYFMIDGCAGSTCDITLDVIGTCGTGIIDPWSGPVMGPLTTCVGNVDTYTVEDLNGAVEYYYYLDGVLIDDGTEQYSTDITWTTPGTYQLCVDVSNLPCIPESDDPLPNCIDIVVCAAAEAGTFTINPNPACPGETINYSLIGNNTNPDMDQYIIIADASGTILQLETGSSGSFVHDKCDIFKIFSYNVKNGGPVPMVGTVFPTDYPACMDNCCDIEEDELEFEDTIPPVFTAPPNNEMYTCFSDVPPMADLDWTDNCLGSGLQPGKESGTADLCNGGMITRDWEVKDSCNNVTLHTQIIVIDPVPVAMFINPPADVTITCDLIPTSAPDLTADNGETGSCGFNMIVPGTTSGTADLCGGVLLNEWMTTDDCGRDVVHSQTVTVDPVPEAMFVNPPANITVDCNNIPTTAPDLDYTNNETGLCEIAGTITPVMSGTGDICGGTITYTWDFIDACNRPLTYSQNIEITPIPEAAFVNPPADITVDCNSIPSTAPDLDYTNGETGACEIMGSVAATVSGTGDECGGTIIYMWEFTDQCNRQIVESQTITITPMPLAAFVNPPADITVDCNNLPSTPPDLDFTNGETGACAIVGSVAAVVSGTGDICGGTITNTWEYMDICNRPISVVQNITITPIPEPVFLNPPTDITVTCNNIPTMPVDLDYTNSETGTCEILGTVSPTVVDNSSSCGGTIEYTWEITDQCNRVISESQTITIDPAPQANYINPPADITVDCSTIPSTAPSLMLTNGETGTCLIEATVDATLVGAPSPCGGSFQYVWSHTDLCNRVTIHTQNVTVNPVPQAQFDPTPPDLVVDCDNIPAPGVPLNYDNGETGLCSISGTITAIRTGVANECGGTLTDQWSFTDGCGRNINTNRIITVNPAPIAAWINLPSDITIDCPDVSNIDLNLDYDNGQSGDCQIQGSVTAIAINNFDACGGTIVHTWTFTDACNRTINTSRTVTVNPAPDPIFINPPSDITLECGDVFTPPNTLVVTNGLTGDCEITGTAILSQTTSPNLIENEWFFTHPCTGQILTYLQQVTTFTIPDISVEPEFTNACIGSFFDLSTLDVVDANGTNFNITYHLASPPAPWNEVDPLVEVFGVSIYYIYAQNDDGCADEVQFLIYGDEPYYAGEDVSVEICKNGNTIDLDSYLSSDAAPQGFWIDLDGEGIDVSNPTAVNINNVNPGSYLLYYFTEEFDSCPGDTAVLTLNIIDDVDYEILNVECSTDNSMYDISVLSNGNTVTASLGTVTIIDANNVEINGIPIGSQVVVTISNAASGCSTEQTINSPNCDCPDILRPSGTTNYKICASDVPLTMTVAVDAGLNANWYDSQSSLTPLLTNSLTFDHTNPIPGVYNYYVEAIDPVTLCVSQERLKIEVEVVTRPIANDVNPKLCDNDDDGIIAFDLIALVNMINPNPSNIITFHATIADADAESNPLLSPYTNTGSNQIIYAVVKNSTGCKSTSIVTLTVLAKPVFDLEIIDEACLGDNNGKVVITDIVANGQTQSSLGSGAFSAKVEYDSLSPRSYTIRLRDTANCIGSQTFDINEGQKLTIESFTSVCDNNGTLSDATDDSYTLTFTISNSLGATSDFLLEVDGVPSGTFSYGVEGTYTLPSDGSSKVITFTDAVNGCSVMRNVGPLNPCSTSCVITVENLTYDCSDNGTENNPTDDFYEVILTASSINGSVANSYILFVDGTVRGVGMYGEPFIFNVNASPMDIVLNLQDSEDTQCQISATLLDLDPCSDGCSVSLDIFEYICDNNGTILDKTDDSYTIGFVGRSVNTGSADYDLLIDGGQPTNYNYGDTIRITLPADGLTHLFRAEDSGRPECFIEVTTNQLNNCSTDCEINMVVSDIVCDNNGTNDDDTDDTYTFRLLVTGGKGNMWSIDGTSISGPYGLPVDLGPFNIIDGPLLLRGVDADIIECTESITVIPPQVCSGCIQTMSVTSQGEINCLTPSVDVEATVSESGTYLWTYQGGIVSTTLVGSAGSEGYYVFEVVFPDNCSLIDSIFVNSDDNIPTANAGPDQDLNCEVKEVSLDGSQSTLGTGLTYEWTDASGTVISNDLILNVTTPGEYFLQVIDSQNSCESAKDKVVVQEFLDEPSTAIYANPGDEFDCIIAEIILTTDNEPNVTYTWITPEITFTDVDSISVTDIGEYILIATNVNSLCFDSSSIEILSFQEYPIIELNVDSQIDCDTDFVTISAEGSQTGPSITYQWYDLEGNLISTQEGTLEVQDPGAYILVLSDFDNGCTNSDTIEVISVEVEVGIEIESLIEVVQGETIILKPQVNIPIDEIATIFWDPSDGLSCTDCLEPTVTIDEDIIYTVTIIDIYGCEGTATISLKALVENVITVPNIIRPGSGSGNDQFIVSTNDPLATIDLMTIYDRWGNKIFASTEIIPNSPQGAWDGRFNGFDVVPGVYVYYIRGKLGNGQDIELSGDLTVIK